MEDWMRGECSLNICEMANFLMCFHCMLYIDFGLFVALIIRKRPSFSFGNDEKKLKRCKDAMSRRKLLFFFH